MTKTKHEHKGDLFRFISKIIRYLKETDSNPVTLRLDFKCIQGILSLIIRHTLRKINSESEIARERNREEGKKEGEREIEREKDRKRESKRAIEIGKERE